jgi:hypothetical protein
MAFMSANSSPTDPRHALPASAYHLQCAAEALHSQSCGAHAVSALPVTLTHVQEALNLLAVSIRWIAYAAADSCGEDGPSVDEDSLRPQSVASAARSDKARGASSI